MSPAPGVSSSSSSSSSSSGGGGGGSSSSQGSLGDQRGEAGNMEAVFEADGVALVCPSSSRTNEACRVEPAMDYGDLSAHIRLRRDVDDEVAVGEAFSAGMVDGLHGRGGSEGGGVASSGRGARCAASFAMMPVASPAQPLASAGGSAEEHTTCARSMTSAGRHDAGRSPPCSTPEPSLTPCRPQPSQQHKVRRERGRDTGIRWEGLGAHDMRDREKASQDREGGIRSSEKDASVQGAEREEHSAVAEHQASSPEPHARSLRSAAAPTFRNGNMPLAELAREDAVDLEPTHNAVVLGEANSTAQVKREDRRVSLDAHINGDLLCPIAPVAVLSVPGHC